EETVSTLDDLVREGKVRYVGASNYTGWQLATALGVAGQHGWEPYVSLQPQYSLVSRDIERELLPLAEYAGLAVLPWSPLGGGLLSGKYRPGEAPADDTRAADSTPSALLMRMRMRRSATSPSRRRSPTSPASWAGPWRRSRSTGCCTRPRSRHRSWGRAPSPRSRTT